ncbi:MAG: polysaccharide biosynthesis C-terminal domain-containing protein [Lewinellaceae bacterium]|nr:polysaccharide biosynthesis C-terminal domain-containing protein [Saprospiraceae bacterium]MCB9329605.1 polysaccharide biosynthesis C-terminal domain-containing protein [Lewinellaceae bacterium]
MGIIQRQGIKHSIVNFTGLAIGTLCTLFLYAQKEVVEAYGFIQYLLSIAMIGFPIFSLAAPSVAFRFFPKFQDKSKGHNGLLALLISMSLVGWVVCALFAWLNWDWISASLAQDSVLLDEYLWIAFPLTLLYTLALLLNQYSANFKLIVVPSILFDLSLKVVLPALLFAMLMHWIDLRLVLWLLLGHFCMVILSIMLYQHRMGELSLRFDWGFLKPALRSEIGKYAGFSVLTGLALLLATKADTLMVGTLTTMKSTGIYAIALNIAAALEIPTKSMYGASVSFVAKYLADENWTELRSLYRKVSINLLTAGLLIFGCIWVSADDLYTLMPNSSEVSQGKYVLLFLSVAKLVDMAAGLNNQLVYYSKYYRYSLVSLGVLAAANIGFNVWLIPKLGLTGAAIATLLSITCYNLFNLYLVWKKFRMQPFTRNNFVVIILAVFAIGAVWFLPSTGYSFLNIVVRAGLFSAIFAVLVLRFRVSEDIDGLVNRVFNPVEKSGRQPG